MMTLRTMLVALIWMISTTMVFAQQNSADPLFCDNSPFNQRIDPTLNYIPENRIGSFRQNQTEWSMPIYRIDDTPRPIDVQVINEYSRRSEFWPIPAGAEPATADDHHMAIIVPEDNTIYELWNARWQPNGNILAGGMKSFALDGNGISDPPNQRVTAAGFAVSAGMVTREDFTNLITGELDPEMTINHALTMSLHREIVAFDTFISPAVGGETLGEASVNDGIPMGARFALPPELSEADLAMVHPFTRAIALAARDYGVYVNDTNTSEPYRDRYVGNLRAEPGLLEELYRWPNDFLIFRVQRELATIIETYGIYRVDFTGSTSCNG